MKIWLLVYAEDEPYMGGCSAKMEMYAFATEVELLADRVYKDAPFNKLVAEMDTDQIKGVLSFIGCMSYDREFREAFEAEKQRRWMEEYPDAAKKMMAIKANHERREAEKAEARRLREEEKERRKAEKAGRTVIRETKCF